MPSTRLNILIVEELAVFACDLCDAVERANGTVIGPTASIRNALTLAGTHEKIHGAILDLSLPDGEIGPVAALLMERGIPIVLQSGGAPPDWAERHPGLKVLAKPACSARLVREIVDQLGAASPVS